MLYAIEANGDLRQITTIPHSHEFENWRARLSDPEYNQIYSHLMDRIDEKDIETSSWIPGAEWENTIFWPIYETACNHDVDAAAKCFGLIVWQVVMDHPDSWSFGRYEKDGTPIEGMTYFRITQHTV